MHSVNSSFLCNDKGLVGILFDDPNFVRAETILFERETGNVHALIDSRQMLVGHLSGQLVQAFSNQNKVTLTSRRVDGSMLDLEARLVVLN
jgi:hypothetical protein